MIMADKIPLLSELDRFIDLFTWHNYERQVKRGFSCSDTSIRHPYSPDDTIPVLRFMVVVPFLVVTCHGIINYWMLKRDFTFQLPRPMGMVGGALLTALLTAGIKLYTGKLAPNFYEGCQPYVNYSGNVINDVRTLWTGRGCCDGSLNYHTEFTCAYPERLREVSRSFPCMYTSLAYFSWIYLSIFCVYAWSASRYTLAVIVVTFLAPPTTIALTRLHNNRSHREDVIVGGMLGIFIAAVFAIGTASRGKSIGKTTEKVKGKPLKPTVRVCSSALQSNVEGFVKEVDDLLYGFIECVEFSELPYNDLDAFTLDGWDKNDVIILCHSIDNRRLSLTDVTDALYDNFIPKVSKFCGKESLIVIAHDFRWKGDQAKARQALETTLHAKQPTAYEYAGNVILAGKLGEEKTYDGLWDQDWDVIRDVISNWCKMKK